MWETETDDEEEVGMDQVKELVFDLVVEFLSSIFPQVQEHQPSEVIAHDDDHEVKKAQHFHKELIIEDSLSTGSLNSKSGVGISKLHPGGETSFSVLSPFH